MRGMEDILKAAHVALCKARGVELTYSRGEVSVDLVGVPGSTPFRFEDANGAGWMRVVSRDYLVLAERLVLGGQPIQPTRGDRITEVKGAVTRVYEVLAPSGSDEPEWRWSDSYRVVMRIHTKEIEDPPEA